MTETLTPETSQAEAPAAPGVAADASDQPAEAPPAPGVAADASDQPAEAPPAPQPAEGAHEHPSDWQYIKIALWLALLTAIEVFTYFESVHNLSDAGLYVVLTVLMVLKFNYVAAWFMHLKFDSQLFRQIFQVGIVLALGVYIAMLTAFEIW